MTGRMVTVDTGWQDLTVPGSGSPSGGAVELLEVKLAATQFAVLHSALVYQRSEENPSTEYEQTSVSVKRGIGYTSGALGGPATVVKGNSADAAHGLSVASRNNATPCSAGGGSLEEIPHMCGTFNILAGEWERTPTPEMRPTFNPSQGIILGTTETFHDTITLRAVLVLELFG